MSSQIFSLVCITILKCSIAKTCFEKSKVSEGFEALARAQHLLRSEISLVKMPLLSQARYFSKHFPQ